MKTLTFCILLSTGMVAMAQDATPWFQRWTDYRSMIASADVPSVAAKIEEPAPVVVTNATLPEPVLSYVPANTGTNAVIVEPVQTQSVVVVETNTIIPEVFAVPVNPDELRLNFRGAPIEMVLNYLSDAAGFIIQLNTPVQGRVDVWSGQPVTRDEAVDLLNSVLNRNGLAAIRNGRTLTIMSHDDALHGDIPVKVSDDPQSIPKNDEIVTLIIPVKYVEAEQLVKDLSPLVSPHATIIANGAGNSVVVTDTQANIHHLAEIIKAIDSSAEDIAEIRVFHLEHHDPVEVASLLTGLFSDTGNTTGAAQSPFRFGFGGFGGFGGGRGGGAPGGGGAATANSQSDRIKKRARVVAVPDQRTSSVVVTASKDMMGQIGSMIEQIDQDSPKVAHVSVIHLENADPQQVQQVLQDMFQNGTSSRGGSSQNSPLMTRIQQQQSSSSQSTTLGGGSSGRIGTSRTGAGASF